MLGTWVSILGMLEGVLKGTSIVLHRYHVLVSILGMLEGVLKGRPNIAFLAA